MRLAMLIKTALRSLGAHKLRTFLAMLGIIFGVASVIAMLALVSGTRVMILQRVQAMGTNLLMIRPGNRGSRGVVSGTQLNLKLDDAQAIVREVSGVGLVAPVVGGNAQVKFASHNSRVNITGAAATYFPIRDFAVERGRAFSEQEAERLARVAVIGPVTAENLFDKDDPLDQVIKVKGINFRVIGVLKSKGDFGFFNPDDQVIIPYSTAMKQLFGVDYLREIDVNAADVSGLNQVSDGIAALLRKRHRLEGNAADDFNIQNQAEMLEMFDTTSRTMTLLLGGIAGISLLVGGIGIMNIMLVTVTERTREIGIRKAIGARRRDILGQFLIEAMTLSGLGGIFGCLCGAGLVFAITRLFGNFPTQIQPWSIFMSLAFSAAVGIFFGFYPAFRAAQLHPIEALRYE
jgi:putative ABC transport system permease protein